jgi:hypothetical protein
MQGCMYVCNTYVCVCTWYDFIDQDGRCVYVCMYVCMYVFAGGMTFQTKMVYVCVCVYVCMYVCMYVFVRGTTF